MRQALEAPAAVVDRGKLTRQYHLSFGQRKASMPLPPSSATPEAMVVASFADKAVYGPGLTAPVPVSRELRRQSSLPPLSGAQPVCTPARMAQTPPADMSRLSFLATGSVGVEGCGGGLDGRVGGGGQGGTQADAAAAAAAVAAASISGGFVEVLEHERSRLSVRGRRSSPAESRIAAVAIATQKAAEAAKAAAKAAMSEHKEAGSSDATASAAAAGAAAASSAASTSLPSDSGAKSTAVLSGSGSVAIAQMKASAGSRASSTAAVMMATSATTGSEPKEPARFSHASKEEQVSESGGGGGGADVAPERATGRGVGEGQGDRAALPGLNDFVSNGQR